MSVQWIMVAVIKAAQTLEDPINAVVILVICKLMVSAVDQQDHVSSHSRHFYMENSK